MTGERFGRLVAIEVDHIDETNCACWLCRCDCGGKKIVRGIQLRLGVVNSCGCLLHQRARNFKDLAGKRFGRLLVIEPAGKDKGWRMLWRCNCACGKEIVIPGTYMVSGDTRSCGCLRREGTHRTHGMKGTPEYRAWKGMIQRCTNPKVEFYKDYGGRGIKVSSQWRHDFQSFFKFIGPRPSAKHSLDRFPDVNGNYEPGNVRWATQKQQMLNTRRNNVLTFRGETLPLGVWAERLGINYGTLQDRIRNHWSVERALTEPVKSPA